ncbi:hypothetical protein ACF059_12400 [Streptomyces sp. NPDC016562]|uniref:hypothetical protein n=1 Tax=Streptomyces sp. NPDC016562 TaxID=3364966 RepID=UPI0037004614
MPRHPLAGRRTGPSLVRRAHRAVTRPGRLLAGLLGLLLLATVHCSFHPADDGHGLGHGQGQGISHGHRPGYASAAPTTAGNTVRMAPAGAGEDRHPQHDQHHATCVSPGLTPQTQNTSQPTAGAPGLLLLSLAGRPPALAPSPSARHACGPHPPPTGRSTLTTICRWRI